MGIAPVGDCGKCRRPVGVGVGALVEDVLPAPAERGNAHHRHGCFDGRLVGKDQEAGVGAHGVADDTAAAHVGLFTPGVSAQVTIVMGPGAQSFEGIGRNGVKSSSYGPSDSSYSFKSGEPGQIDWITTLERVPDDFHSPLTLVCPPKGHADTYIWGTDVYTSSSGICVAAVHAGVITLDAGGRVTLTFMPKQETFDARERYGISSQKWTNWDFMSYGQPFKVVSSLVSPSQRTISLVGFTAAGSALVIVPRTIVLNGFEATGTASLIVSRTIQLNGWTGAGIAKQNIRR